MPPISFEGRVAIVTGAGGGIGRTHALEIARRGGAVVVNDLGGDVAGREGSATMAESVVAEIAAAGGRAVASHDSVTTREGAEGIVATALDAFGGVDVLVNNAGNMRNAFLAELSDEDWDSLIATHLTGSFNMTRAVWPHMQARKYGRIVFTSSSSGMFGIAIQGGYAAGKAGAFGLMNVAAIEGAPHGILCNAIMPNAFGRMAIQCMKDWGQEVRGVESMPPVVGNSMDPNYNAPLVAYLASEVCTSNRAVYSQCLGRIARVFVGVGEGWQAQRQTPPTVEEIAAHWDEINDLERGYTMPASPHEELALVMQAGEMPAH